MKVEKVGKDACVIITKREQAKYSKLLALTEKVAYQFALSCN